MVKRRVGIGLLLIALMSILGIRPAAAQTYSFGVPELLMQVYVQPDASVRIVYDITFENYGSPIDIVDIGTPTKEYSISTMQASINGVNLTDIRKSEVIDVGVEVHLGGQAIASGKRGTLHFEFLMPNLVFSDTTNKENASLQITPTWFDASSVRGTGRIEIRVTLPEGVQPDEVLYQDVKFTDKGTENGRMVAIWRFENVAATKAYRVGLSFPQRVMTRVVTVTFWDLLIGWLGGALTVVGGLIGGCLPLILPIGFIYLFIRGISAANKPKYLPPIAQTEGGGIKRGLTAPEAAVILELPLTKVLTLVIFGLLEKGLVRQTKEDPLTLEVVEDYRVKDKPHLQSPADREKFRRHVAQQKGTVIHKYEDAFLDLIEDSPAKPVKDLNIVTAMQGLVDTAAAKMKGFDLSDTQDYYRRVIQRAMEQAAALGDIQQREQYLDHYLPWVMMDKSYGTVMTVGHYNYWPRWARTTSYAGPPLAAGTAAASARPSGGRSTATFGDVAASFTGWAETTMGGMAAAIMPTRLSKPAPPSTSSSGGFSSSCACACAGCACACACAGGGR